MRKIGIFLLGLLMLPTLCMADETAALDSLKAQADKAFAQEKYEQAAEISTRIADSVTSVSVCYNLGCTYYRLDSMAQSVLWFERALKLNPADENIECNLRLALEKTIDRYNNVFVKNGKDDDFGKTPVNLTKRIEKGPFWACYTGMTVHHTMGGLNTNTKAQLLDWQGKVIPRIYAAGEITGGIHGTNRVGGNAVLDCFVFGQIAGENAAKETIL